MKRRLGFWGTLGLSVGLMAPTAAMALNGILPTQLVGRAAPLSFLVAFVGIVLVAYGFVRLTRRFNHAGSVYALCGRTIGPRVGFLAGFALLGVYLAFTIDAIPATALFATQFLAAAGIWSNASWLLFGAITAAGFWYLGTRPIRLATRTLLTVEGVSVSFIVLLMIVIFVRLATGHAPDHQQLTLSPFTPGAAGLGAVAGASVYGFLSWAGFEASATLGEEAVNPRRSIPRALVGVIAFSGLFFILCIWLQTLGFGVGRAGIKAFGNSSAPLGQLSALYVGDWLRLVLDAGAMVSLFASGLASAVGAGRIMYALSRDGFGPAVLSRTSRRADVPAAAVTFIVVLATLVDVVLYVTGTRSDLNQYYYAATIGVLGILLVYALAEFGALRHLFIRRQRLAPIWEAVLPVAGIGYLGYVFYKNVIPVPDTVYKYFPYVMLAWVVIGLAAVIARPALARRIGQSLSAELPEDQPDLVSPTATSPA
jgi:amino acid transporter